MIEVRELSVAFKGERVLHNINLTIPEGKRTIIAGKSGSGKSVLIKTVEGIIKPSEGTVFIDGVDIFSISVKHLNSIRQKMSLLFQSSALFDSMNIFQNVAFPLVEHKKYPKEEVIHLVTEKLQLVGLQNVLPKMPSELSGGMKKRAALARAIITEPKYIFYDEPTTGLDPQISHDIVSLILELQETLNHTAVIITHDVKCIQRTADNVVILEDGKILFDGSYESFLQCDRQCCKQFRE